MPNILCIKRVYCRGGDTPIYKLKTTRRCCFLYVSHPLCRVFGLLIVLLKDFGFEECSFQSPVSGLFSRELCQKTLFFTMLWLSCNGQAYKSYRRSGCPHPDSPMVATMGILLIKDETVGTIYYYDRFVSMKNIVFFNFHFKDAKYPLHQTVCIVGVGTPRPTSLKQHAGVVFFTCLIPCVGSLGC